MNQLLLGKHLAYYARRARYVYLKPVRLFYYFIGGLGWNSSYRSAVDKWKQSDIGFISADEYRLFHKKM